MTVASNIYKINPAKNKYKTLSYKYRILQIIKNETMTLKHNFLLFTAYFIKAGITI